MSVMAEARVRSPFGGPEARANGTRHVTLLPSAVVSGGSYKHPDAMDTTPPNSATLAPPQTSSPEAEMDESNQNGSRNNHSGGQGEQSTSTNGANGATLSAAAATSAQQPKVVQTAFIHKLYKYVTNTRGLGRRG